MSKTFVPATGSVVKAAPLVLDPTLVIGDSKDVLLLKDGEDALRLIRPSNAELDVRLLPKIIGPNVDFEEQSAPKKYTTRSN